MFKRILIVICLPIIAIAIPFSTGKMLMLFLGDKDVFYTSNLLLIFFIGLVTIIILTLGLSLLYDSCKYIFHYIKTGKL